MHSVKKKKKPVLFLSTSVLESRRDKLHCKTNVYDKTDNTHYRCSVCLGINCISGAPLIGCNAVKLSMMDLPQTSDSRCNEIWNISERRRAIVVMITCMCPSTRTSEFHSGGQSVSQFRYLSFLSKPPLLRCPVRLFLCAHTLLVMFRAAGECAHTILDIAEISTSTRPFNMRQYKVVALIVFRCVIEHIYICIVIFI